MAYFLWMWQWLAPVFFFIGGFYLLENGDELILILGGVSAVIGLLVGIFGWGATVPPRWFWVKSASQLANKPLTTTNPAGGRPPAGFQERKLINNPKNLIQ